MQNVADGVVVTTSKTPPAGPATQRQRRRAALSGNGLLLRVISVVVVLGGWEIVGRSINPIFLSYPSAIVRAAPAMVQDGLLGAAGQSLIALVVGFVAAVVIGIVVGVLSGRYLAVNNLIDIPVTSLYVTPYIALVPIFTLWFGLGLVSKIVIIFYAAVFPILLNTQEGVRASTQAWVDAVRVEGARQMQLTRYVILPAALPNIMTGLRIGVGRAVVGMVVAEMFTAISGLGGQMITYSNQFRTDKVFVVVILLALIGSVATALMGFFEKRVARWREESRTRFS
jgi:NitT/TauT family transport system permease protein